ncbi:MAG: choice-of-anchor U domain-containing protein, partial [Archaeoglobaceae archaeon]
MNKIVVAIILYAFFVAIAKGGVVDNTTKIVEIHDIYFVGENVVVKTNFEPGKSFIVDPKGEKIPLNFTSQNRTFFAEFELKKNVLIGRYTLILDEIQKDFVVDFCELNFSYEEGLLNLTAKTFFAEPRIRYSVGPLQGEGVALVSIPLEAGEHEFVAECGKSVLKGNVSVNFSIVYDGVVFAVLDGKAVNATLKVENYEFQGNFDPRKLNLTKFRVKAEYKHLRTSKEFDLSLGLREVYFPKEKIVIKADFAEKGKLIDPTGKVHELTFKDGVAEFELSKEIVLGVYKVVVGSVERSFYVDSYEISTSFDGEKVKGNVSWHFIAPRFVEVVTKNESFKVELVNDTFEFKIDEDALIKCGNAEVIVKKKSVELRDYYFLGDVVEVKVNFDAEKGKVLAPWGESLLEFKNRSAEFFANETGMYKVIVDGIAREFVVDNCELNASFDGKKIIGKAKCVYRAPEVYYNISGIEGSAKVVNGSFEITDLPTGSHTAILKCGNAQISLELKVLEPKEIVLRDLYFLGDEVEINLRFAPEKALLTTPSKSFELNFTKMNESYVAKFVVEEIGKHRVEIDNVTKDFVVDNYRVNATILDQKVVGNVSWDFVKPEFVEFRSALGEGKVNISESGDFEIPIGENWEFLELKCGNSVMKLIERKIFVKEIFFVGEEVEVVANFKPNESYLIFGNESSEVEFEEANGSFVYKFIAEKPGIYELRVDDVEKKIFVDSCKLNATILDRKVAGNVSTIFSRISSLGLVLQPLNVSSFVEVRNGTFEFQLPKNVSEVVLICKNSVLRLKVERAKVSDFRSVEVEGMKFNFSIDKGKFEDLSFDGENLSFVISGLNQGEEVSLGISLPFEIPEALHLYYWKEVDGKSFAVDYSLGEDRKSVVLKLKDGEDEDGTANGVIVDPLKLYVPKLKVEKLIDGKKGLLRIEKEKEKSLEIKVESSGMIKYLAFVDAENLPSKPVDFPYGLLKFEIEVNRGDEAEIRITYPSLQDMIDDNGKAKFYKFNPKTLEWSVFDAEVENNTVILRFKDGGFGDEDGVADGVISDDGGVGWAGYAGLYGASICRDEKTNETHTYWIYVPSGDSFNISVYDGDGFIVRVYYPNGTLYGSYTAPSNNAWNNFIINTNLAFGWWKLEIFEDSWPSNNGNYYGLRVNGTDDINIRVNHSYSVGTTIMYGTPDSVIVGEETSLNISQNYYVFADSFLVAIYDPDGTPRRPALRIDVTSPDGQSSSWTPSDNDVWATQ